MLGKLTGWNDTICALATPPGIGAIGVIRVSGNHAINIVNQIFPSKDLTLQKTHTLHVGLLQYNNVVIDEVVIALFKGPKSYTGENVIEISCHGSHYIQQQLLETLQQLGCRIAKPGEFTQRAFINGKLDLTQAEAVADVIASNTEASKKTALRQIRGGFSSSLQQLRDELIQFSSLIELELDFSQEDVEFANRDRLMQLLQQATTQVQHLLQSFQWGNVVKNGVQVAIVGKPNAGKSTLLNTLLQEDRAIVSDIAGTTRDTIEETLNIKGILFRLIDTAGIREHTQDVIEQVGIGKSKAAIEKADIVVYLFDVNDTEPESLAAVVGNFQQQNKRYLLVGNKADLASPLQLAPYGKWNALLISAQNKNDVAQLQASIYNATVQQPPSEDVVVTNARHVSALQQIQQSLTDITDGLNHQVPGDLLALDIRRCLHFLGEITGEITHEDQLDYIFSKFCIGK
jgi:tRNA modification GTPase